MSEQWAKSEPEQQEQNLEKSANMSRKSSRRAANSANSDVIAARSNATWTGRQQRQPMERGTKQRTQRTAQTAIRSDENRDSRVPSTANKSRERGHDARTRSKERSLMVLNSESRTAATQSAAQRKHKIRAE
jgi:hypothetical protein